MAKPARKYAYICAPRDDMRKTIEYSRTLFDLGYMPISPWLIFRNFISMVDPDELAAAEGMAKALIRRCTVFVVCGQLTAQMREECRYAREIGKHRTLLDGMVLLDGYEKHGLPPEYTEREDG